MPRGGFCLVFWIRGPEFCTEKLSPGRKNSGPGVGDANRSN